MIAITLARKPLAGTVARNVLTHGTGGLNINACRIAHTSAKDLEDHQKMVEALRTRGGSLEGSWKNSSDLSGANPVSTAGRWPSNLILVHRPGCRQVGTCTEKQLPLVRWDDGSKPFGGGAGHPFTKTEVPDVEVPVWECVEGCPVAALDRQSGVTHNTSHYSYKRSGAEFINSIPDQPEQRHWRQDTGGASRFFLQVQEPEE